MSGSFRNNLIYYTEMKKECNRPAGLIASFQVDHTKIVPGIYESRTDEVGGEFVTTFDIRMKAPNRERDAHDRTCRGDVPPQ